MGREDGFTGEFARRKRRRVPPRGREHGGFLGGFAFAGGAFIAAVAGVVVMLVFILGCAGIFWWNAALERDRQRAEADLIARQTQLETEQAERAAAARERAREQEAQRLYRQQAAEAEKRQQELEAERERARLEHEAEATRRHLTAEKAQAEARKAKSEAERAKIEADRIERERQAREAALEAERRRKAAEEFRRPLATSARDLWRKGASLKGRTVVFKAAASCTVFSDGTMLVKVYDPASPKRLWVQGMVGRVEPGWKLDQGVNLNVTVNLMAVVDRVGEAGAVQVSQCRVLGLD